MEQESELVAQLTRLGLTSYEAKAYLALIKRDSFTAAQVSRQSGLPRQRIYDVLGSLVQKGLAVARPGSVVKYSATAPELAIDQLLQAHRQQLTEMEREARSMASLLKPAYEAGKEHTDPLEYIEVLRDRRAINERFAELQSSVKREILVFTKPPYATPPQENVEGLEVSLTHEARSIYEFGVFDDPAVAEGVRRFIEAGEEARFVPELPLKLVIIDETIVMFGMEDPVANSSDLTIVVVEHTSLARVLKTAFDAIWANGLTFDQAHDRLVKQRAKTA
ncbi:MAG TPA: helix-turn-helix domain-containing protein [Candidatus Limnocylindrales bacterium]|jgi:HTH-type transcriptional regulator, sugar sensing transcriptional regulator|nr:helix-turn-helix domain-containing protein [Candidatus Limnocylindrales bacterium]